MAFVIGAALLSAGTAAAVGGGGIYASMKGAKATQDANAASAIAQAEASNKVLAASIARQRQLQGLDTGYLNDNLAHYTPEAQGAQLTAAQGARSAAGTGAISGPDLNIAGITSDAPAAVRGEIAKRMASVHDYNTHNADAMGKLEGYNDSMQTNSLNDANATRNIGFINDLSNEEKSLVAPRTQIAQSGAYTPPSPYGALLTGAGNIAGSAAPAAGQGLYNILTAKPTATVPTAPTASTVDLTPKFE